MVKVILNGANGAMGKVVADLVAADENMENWVSPYLTI